jgi:Tfp pilus assembly protein PilF
VDVPVIGGAQFVSQVMFRKLSDTILLTRGFHMFASTVRGWNPSTNAWVLDSGRIAFSRIFILLMFGLAVRHADAQITTQNLIGDSVSEVSSRYDDVDKAIQRFTNGDELAARQFLDSAKRKDPNLPPVDLLMAKLYMARNNPTYARASLEAAAKENPDDPEPFLILADQAIQQGRAIEADALYDRGLILAEKFNANAKRKRNFQIRAHAGRSVVAQRRKDWQSAVNDLKALLKIDPENATAHYRLGQALCMQKQFQDGYNEFDAAKKADKTIHDPNVATALMYDQLKMSDKAQQFFDRALAAKKDDLGTLTAYAQWLIKSGAPANIAKAETVLAEARKANPGNLNLLILSGVAAKMNKKMKPAEDFFIEALGIAPANVDTINQLALLLIEQQAQDKRDRALQFAAISSQLNNQSGDAQITLAWILFQLGRGADASTALRNGVQLNNLSPDSSFLVAKIQVATNNANAAKQILKNALESDYSGIFVYRQDAQALLDTLNKEAAK